MDGTALGSRVGMYIEELKALFLNTEVKARQQYMWRQLVKVTSNSMALSGTDF